MRSRWSFRKAALVTFVGLTLSVATASAQGPPLFAPSAVRDAVPATATPRIRRARRVTARADLLAAAMAGTAAPDAPFLLNLFDDVALTLRRVRVDEATPGHRTWVGTSGAGDDDVAALTAGPAGLTGRVVARGVSYAIDPAGAGDLMVQELAAIDPPPELPALVAPPVARDTTPRAGAALAAGGPVRIDVLVLYTPAARVRAGGLAAIAASLANAVAVTNTALQRSGIDATLATAALRELPYAESSGGITNDLVALAPGGSMHATVESIRAAAGADLVALVVGRATPTAGCGVAYLGPSPSAIASVTEDACLFAGQWSFSHEIGHNFGADHAPGDPIVSPVPYARGYRDSAVRTLMAYAAPGAPARSLNYSSSTVREPAPTGGPTGNSLQDNARRFTETAATVAAYATAGPPPETPGVLTATVLGGTVTLAWLPPPGGGPVSGYRLDAGLAPGASSYGPFFTTAPGVTFLNVLPGRYYARVRSVGAGGESAPSADVAVDVTTACAVPGPAAISVTVSAGIAVLRWFAPPGNGATSYDVGIGSAPGLLDLGVFHVGTLTAAAVPAPPGRYVVRARGTNTCGAGAPSAELLVVVP